MSFNDVQLFGTLEEDVVVRKNRSGQHFAVFRVRTYKFVTDSLTGSPREVSVVHEVHDYDERSCKALMTFGKAGAWIRVKGEIGYKDNGMMFVRVPTSGGMATVSTYFGIGITPSNPGGPRASGQPQLETKTEAKAETQAPAAVAAGIEPADRTVTDADASGLDALHAEADDRAGQSDEAPTAEPGDARTSGQAGDQAGKPATESAAPVAATPAPTPEPQRQETKATPAPAPGPQSPPVRAVAPATLPRSPAPGLPRTPPAPVAARPSMPPPRPVAAPASAPSPASSAPAARPGMPPPPPRPAVPAAVRPGGIPPRPPGAPVTPPPRPAAPASSGFPGNTPPPKGGASKPSAGVLNPDDIPF